MGKHYPKMQCIMTTAALSILARKQKHIYGVCSRVRESLAKRIYNTFKSVLFTETCLSPCKKVLSDHLENGKAKL